MSKEQIQRLRALSEKRENLHGTKLYGMLMNLATTHYAVNRNYREFSIAITNFEGNIAIWDVKKRNELQTFLREISRLLHNYLSSTFSLIRHTSKLCNDLRCNELRKEYDKKVSDFNSNDCVFFIKDLRNFVQHVGLPPPTASISPVHHNVGFRSRILLSKQRLLSWKGWKAGSKRYSRASQDIDLKVVINQYQSLLNQFYMWFYQRVIQQDPREFEEFAKIDREIAKLGAELEKIMYTPEQVDSKIEPINAEKASDAKT